MRKGGKRNEESWESEERKQKLFQTLFSILYIRDFSGVEKGERTLFQKGERRKERREKGREKEERMKRTAVDFFIHFCFPFLSHILFHSSSLFSLSQYLLLQFHSDPLWTLKEKKILKDSIRHIKHTLTKSLFLFFQFLIFLSFSLLLH